MRHDLVEYLATPSEAAFADDIEEVAYGEIYGVGLNTEGEKKVITVTQRTRHLFLLLRRLGKANKVVVTEGEPTMIEYRCKTPSGFQCVKRIKI